MSRLATTFAKNSGILRYRFGALPGGQGTPDPAAFAGALVVGVAPQIITCLGSDILVVPDQDDQIFGESVGSPVAIPPLAGTMFSAAVPVVPWDQTTPQLQNVAPPASLGQPGPSNTPTFIPRQTKVWAFFSPTDTVTGAPGDAVWVQVQLRSFNGSVIRNGATVAINPSYMTFIQVAVAAFGVAGSRIAGTLMVELEHSIRDIPANRNLTQTQVNSAFAPV